MHNNGNPMAQGTPRIIEEDINVLEQNIIEANSLKKMMETEGYKLFKKKLDEGLESLRDFYMDKSKLPIEPTARLAIVDSRMEAYCQLKHFINLAEDIVENVKKSLKAIQEASNYKDYEQQIKESAGDIFTQM